MANKYKDENGHWTTKENDGGPCHHNGGDKSQDNSERENLRKEVEHKLKTEGNTSDVRLMAERRGFKIENGKVVEDLKSQAMADRATGGTGDAFDDDYEEEFNAYDDKVYEELKTKKSAIETDGDQMDFDVRLEEALEDGKITEEQYNELSGNDEYNREMAKAQEENAMESMTAEDEKKSEEEPTQDEEKNMYKRFIDKYYNGNPEEFIKHSEKRAEFLERHGEKDYAKRFRKDAELVKRLFGGKEANTEPFKGEVYTKNEKVHFKPEKTDEKQEKQAEKQEERPIQDEDIDKAMLHSRPRMGLYNSKDLPKHACYIYNGYYIAADDQSNLTHDQINKALGIDLYNDKELIALNPGVYGSRIASIDIPQGKQITDAEWNSIKTFIDKAKAEGKTIDFGHGPYNTKDYDTEDILTMIKRKLGK